MDVDTAPVWECDEFKSLTAHAAQIKKLHLRHLLSPDTNKNCAKRNEALVVKAGNVTLDCTRQRATVDTLPALLALANKANLKSKIESMFNGDKINVTENRSVLHVALRAQKADKIEVDGVNVVDSVHAVLSKIASFSEKVRSGEWKGYSGKPLSNVVSIGIGGSYLGAEFVFEALKTDATARKNAEGRNLRFYANIDPIGFARAIDVESFAILQSLCHFLRGNKPFFVLRSKWITEHINVRGIYKKQIPTEIALHFCPSKIELFYHEMY